MRHPLKPLFGLAIGLAFFLTAGAARAQPQEDFTAFLDGVRGEALAKGVAPATLDGALKGLEPIGRVLELDRHQPEFTLTFSQYMDHVVTPARVAEGRRQAKLHARELAEASKRYGVPARFIVAMWGVESNFGKGIGGFQVIPALATLAYDGRRSHYFRGELLDALKMVDSGVPLERMRGSWAGAMGQCQFMPSTYLHFARRFEGDGQPDIWNRPTDVFASTASYLSGIGWNPRQGWGRAVRLPAHGIAGALVGLDKEPRSLKEWGRLGLRQADGKALPARRDLLALLIRADDEGGPAYLVYDNFRVLMKWNRSVFFAIASGTLADRIGSK